MIVRVEVADAALNFEVETAAEGKRIVRILTGHWWGNGEYAAFDYAGGRKRACIRRSDVRRAGMLTDEEAAREEHGAPIDDE